MQPVQLHIDELINKSKFKSRGWILSSR